MYSTRIIFVYIQNPDVPEGRLSPSASTWFPPEEFVEPSSIRACIKYNMINVSHLNYELQSAHNQSYVDDALQDLAKVMRLDKIFRNMKPFLRYDIIRLRII